MKATDCSQDILVAHLVYSLGTGGLENGLVNLINRSPEGYRHAIICLTESGQFESRITAADIEVFEIGMQPGTDLRAYLRLWKLLRDLQPDIVHSRNLAALEAQLVVALACRAKRVHGEHGRDMHDLDGSNSKYRLLRRILNPLIARFVTVSKDLERWLVSEVGIKQTKVQQIYNGVNSELFHPRSDAEAATPSPADEQLCIGTVGRLVAVKDQQTLLRAFAQLVKSTDLPQGLNSCLRIVGDGPLRADLEREARELGIDDKVEFHGDQNNVGEYLRSMDIFVLPSLGEGVSNTILEAMASGLPIVATNVGGNPELVTDGENGLLVPKGDTAALFKAISKLGNSASTRAAMGQRSLARVKQDFSWQRTAHSYYSIYARLIDRRAEALI